MSKLAVVRVRGSVDVRKKIKDTLEMLNLTRPNQCVIVDDTPSYRGMLQKIKEIVTWGTIKPEVLEKLLQKRGKFSGGDPVTDDRIKEITSFNSIEEFSKAICEGKADFDDVEGLKKVFQLHSPKKGYKSTHLSVHHRGAMGNRDEKINDLLNRMI